MEPAPPPQANGRALLGPGLFVGGAVVAANGLNAVFQIALARILDPPEYSLLVALVVVTLIAAVPPLAFQAAVAREVAVALADGRQGDAGAELRDTVRGLLPWALGVLAFGGAAAAGLAGAGRGNAGATLATAATIAGALVIPAVWGGLQGARLFLVLGLAHLTFAATRLGAGLGIGLAGGDAAEVMAGVAAATAFTLAITLVPLRGLWRSARRSGARRLATLPNAAAATGLTVLTALASVDVLVAKLAFPSHTAGAYGVASVGARALLLVPIGVTTVLFPRVAVLRDPARERRYLLAGLGVVALLGAVTTVLLWVFAGPLIRGVFGKDYAAAVPWLGPLSLAMALYALTTVYVYHFLSLARTRFALVLVGIFAAQLVAFGALHGRPADLVGVQIVAAAVTVLAAEVWQLARR